MVYQAKMNSKPTTIVIGPEIIDILTTGMYNNPLMVLREYVRNSVDAIDLAVEHGKLEANNGFIDIHLDGGNRCITIKDNGVGVSNDTVEQVLCALGCSTKNLEHHRGFRGIGRLGGVGYCEIVRFETRSLHTEKVAIIEWDSRTLKKRLTAPRKTAKAAVRESVRISYRPAVKGEGAHFFNVHLMGIRRFHKDELMNVGAITSYLSQVAPVAFDKARFSYAEEIEDYLRNVDGFACYRIHVNGQRVFRPHADVFEVTSNYQDKIQGIELLDITSFDGSSFGRGWYAQTEHVASIPPRVGMRGLRIRQGNIEVGDEYFLASTFKERRFATWHIGEIHLGYSLKVNARRDGFEQSPQYEAFLEQTSILGAHLSYLCRRSSKNRSGVVAAEIALDRLKTLVQCKLFVDQEHLLRTKGEASKLLARLFEYEKNGWLRTDSLKNLSKLRIGLDGLDNRAIYLADALDGRVLRHSSKKTLLEAVARVVIENNDGIATSDALLLRIFGTYLKPKQSENNRTR